MLLLIAPFFYEDVGAANVATGSQYANPEALTAGTNVGFVTPTDPATLDTSPAIFWGWTQPARSAVDPSATVNGVAGTAVAVVAAVLPDPSQVLEGVDRGDGVLGTLVCPTTIEDCCTGVIKITSGQHYLAGYFEWDIGQDVDGQEVSLQLQGNTHAGSATGAVATVPLTSAQTLLFNRTTHERPEYVLTVGSGDTAHVLIGRAEIIGGNIGTTSNTADAAAAEVDAVEEILVF